MRRKILRHLVNEYVAHYNAERPHQGVGNEPLTEAPKPPDEGDIICFERLGGRLKHYERKAA